MQTYRSWDEYRLLIRAYNCSRDIWSKNAGTYLDDIYAEFPKLTPDVVYHFEKYLAWLLSQPQFIVTKDLILEDKTMIDINREEFDLDWQVQQLNTYANENHRINILTQIGIIEGNKGKYFADLHFYRMDCAQGTGAGLLQRMERAVTIDSFLLDN